MYKINIWHFTLNLILFNLFTSDFFGGSDFDWFTEDDEDVKKNVFEYTYNHIALEKIIKEVVHVYKNYLWGNVGNDKTF